MTRTTRIPIVVMAWLVVSGLLSDARHVRAEEPVMDLELEQLLELDLNLNAMGLSGIHHTHIGREWMVGFRSTSMLMRGNRDGRSSRDASEVLAQFPVVPTEMSMHMQMLSVMYAPSDDWTLMAMLPWTRLSMDHRTAGGARFTTRSEGPGDLKFTALRSAWRNDSEVRTERLVLRAGVSVPTGTLDSKDRTPMGRVTLPYPMQLGSGTPDLLPGITYLAQTDRWAWGVHAEATLRFHENRRHYQLGNRGESSVWLARKLASSLSASLRLNGALWGNTHGADARLNPALVPTADPDRRSGRRVDAMVGFNLFATSGWLDGQRIALEAGVPIYQDLDGPQLEMDWRTTLSWTFTFRR